MASLLRGLTFVPIPSSETHLIKWLGTDDLTYVADVVNGWVSCGEHPPYKGTYASPPDHDASLPELIRKLRKRTNFLFAVECGAVRYLLETRTNRAGEWTRFAAHGGTVAKKDILYGETYATLTANQLVQSIRQLKEFGAAVEQAELRMRMLPADELFSEDRDALASVHYPANPDDFQIGQDWVIPLAQPSAARTGRIRSLDDGTLTWFDRDNEEHSANLTEVVTYR